MPPAIARHNPHGRHANITIRHGPRWDIFCRVVDNYGDAGVAWRLARELAAEQRSP